MDIYKLSALELAKKIRDKEIKATEAVAAVYTRIREREAALHCYVTIRPEEEVLEEARQLQERIDSGESVSALAGVPIAVKDNICTKGLKTTCSSKILENFIPTYDAEVINRLRTAGLLLIGKANMDEFAMGSTTESSAFGVTLNPVNEAHVPGGSSGGSCAAVAAGEAFLALGSDTGGSIRQPASYCGVTGFKPTYGAVSRYGLIAYASSLDQIGPIGKTAADCAALYSIIAGKDTKDSTSAAVPDIDTDIKTNITYENGAFENNIPSKTITNTSSDIKQAGMNGLKIGIPRDYMNAAVSPDITAAVQSISKHCQEQGATVEEFDLGLSAYSIPCYYVLACAEASSNLSRFDGVKYGYRAPEYNGLHDMYKRTRSEGFGSEVKRRILLGSFVLSSGYYEAYYLKALKVKALITKAFDDAFSRYDIILGPTAPTTAPVFGAYEDDPIKMYLSDIYTVSINLAGLPAISLPAGNDTDGMPIGIQLIGKRFSDADILLTAKKLQDQ